MSNDFDNMAAKMFGATTPTSQPNTHPMPADTSLANRMFGETTKSPQPSAPNQWDTRKFQTLDEADQGARMFGGGDPALNHGDGMRSIESAAMEQFLSSPEEAREAAEHWGETFRSFELTSTESKVVADLGVAAFTNLPTPELITTWVEEARTALVADFGPQGASQALADARAYVTMYASPEIRDVLMSTGLGNHPQIVRLAAAKARALKMAGKM